ncbi:MAG: alpha/beta fold hydrolase [Bacteroidota bacterium]
MSKDNNSALATGSKYKHLFFDLDHTLWDFEANAKATLEDLYEILDLKEKGIHDFDLFYKNYLDHNERLWERYRNGHIKQEDLRIKRMRQSLLDFKIADEQLAQAMSIKFLERLPTRTILFPFTKEILTYLRGKGYELHLITNGFEKTQHSSPLLTFFKNDKPVYIIGHSLGGPMAVRLAADNPDYFSGMVLLAGSEDPAEEKPEKWRPILYKTPLKFLVPGAFRPSNQELWYLKKDLVILKNDFSKITCPVWIVHGDKDDMVPVGNAGYAKQMLVNAKKVETKILPGANHFIPWQHYKEIKEVLMGLEK